MDKTRLWKSHESSTMVQFRTDILPLVFIHTNIGWLPIGNAPEKVDTAELFAEEVAAGYELVECCQEEANYFAGW